MFPLLVDLGGEEADRGAQDAGVQDVGVQLAGLEAHIAVVLVEEGMREPGDLKW